MRKHWSHLRQLWSETHWIRLALIWLIGLFLGYVGFARYSQENLLGWSIGDLLYRTLQLVTLESGSVTSRANGMLEVARFLLPALTAYTALQAVMHLFHEQTQWLRLWGLRNHVVVCGLGRKGSHLTNELLALGQRVVVIEKEPKHADMGDLRRRGAILLTGDATDENLLTRARVHRARHLICLLGEDRSNLQIAVQAYHLTRGRRKGTLTCVVHLASPDLLDLVRNSELSVDTDVPFLLETYNPYARAARLLLAEDPAWQDTAAPTDVPDHLLVFGLGRLGESLILQAAYTWYRLGRRGRLQITVLDREAKEKAAHLLQKYPQLVKVCRFNPLSLDLTASDLLQAALKKMRGQNSVQQVYVCLADPILSLQVCLSLHQIPAFRQVPIRVRLEKESGLSGLLEKSFAGGSQVIPFDLYERTCSADLIMGGMHERLALDLHQNYLTTSIANPGNRQSYLPWVALPEKQKEANRQQANRIHQLVSTIGYRIIPLQDWQAGEYLFQVNEVEQMARLEHDLWFKTKQADGWLFGEVKDEKRHTHPDLIPWENLPESEREKNRAFICQLPALLARIGFQIEKI